MPWGEKRPVFPVERLTQPRDKAMTLKQLREMRNFVQRLCKTGLLKYPPIPHNDALGRSKSRIQWTQITHHEIVSEIIKKVIPKENSCSWVEMVGRSQAQPRKFFCSHNWSEPFHDFMSTIDRHARENRAGPEDTYWICVYANDQWKVDLGLRLRESPFYDALKGAEATVLMLDPEGEALLRMWVVFELNETTKALQQHLEVWTPLGQVGSCLVASGSMVNAIKQLDTASATASNTCDQRQIMNHIAGISEMEGISVTSDGGKELDPQHPAGTYEQRLLNTHHKHFDDLNYAVRSAVYKSIQHFSTEEPDLSKHVSIPDPALRGITLAQLRAFAQEIKGSIANADFKKAKQFVLKKTESSKCSYVELIAHGPQKAEYHVTCTWEMPLQDLMEAINWHADARELADTTSYWISLLARNYHQGLQMATSTTALTKALKRRDANASLKSAAGFVLVLDPHGHWAKRGTTVLEAYLAIDYYKSFDLLTAKGAIATTRPFYGGTWMFGEFDEAIASVALDFDVTKSQFKSEKERRFVLGSIADMNNTWAKLSESDKVPESCPGYDQFNQRLRRKVAGPVLREAAFKGDNIAIERVLQACPGLLLDSVGLRGVVGQKALHCATAAGHISTAALLLRLHSDPNTQDVDGETPLHYATLAGQRDMVQLLLDCSADPGRESFSAETPFEVAQENPAFFLGVKDEDIKKLQDLLRVAMQEQWEKERTLTAHSRLSDAEDDQVERPQHPILPYRPLGDHESDGMFSENSLLRLRLMRAEQEVKHLHAENATLRTACLRNSFGGNVHLLKDGSARLERSLSASSPSLDEVAARPAGAREMVSSAIRAHDPQGTKHMRREKLVCFLEACAGVKLGEQLEVAGRELGWTSTDEDIDYEAFLDWVFGKAASG